MVKLHRTADTAVQALPPDTRTALGRVAATQPFKPYVYGGETQEPPAVTAARERYRARGALIDAASAAADAELNRRLAVWRHAESMPDADPDPDGDELAELVEARDRYHAAMTVACPPAPVPPPADPIDVAPPAAARCRRCGYLATAVGHKVACGP